MAGEKDLMVLLKNISPLLEKEDYVFCTFADGCYGDHQIFAPKASFMETEGLTLVLSKEAADAAELNYDGVFTCISLTVHSSLKAVGLTAAVAGKLAEYNISANVIAAYYHDHIFVPKETSAQAMRALQSFREPIEPRDDPL